MLESWLFRGSGPGGSGRFGGGDKRQAPLLETRGGSVSGNNFNVCPGADGCGVDEFDVGVLPAGVSRVASGSAGCVSCWW